LLALLAGIAFSLSVWGGRWWVIADAAEVGPFGGKRCHFDKTCEPAGLTWLGTELRWIRIGMATWAAGLISTLLVVVMAAAFAARRVPRLVAKMVLVSIATGTIVGVWFFLGFPNAEYPAAEIDRGVPLFFGATLLGAIAAMLALRARPDP
jgi:hypothetical protein